MDPSQNTIKSFVPPTDEEGGVTTVAAVPAWVQTEVDKLTS